MLFSDTTFWTRYRISQLARHSAPYGLNVIRIRRIDNEYRGTQNTNFLERGKKKTSRPRIVESKFRCNIRLILHFALRTLPNNFHYRIPSLANSEQQESETERIDQCPSLPEKTPSLSSFKPGTRPPSSPQPCSANFLGSCLFYFYFPQRPSYFHARGTRYSPGITSLINLVVITPLLVCKASGAGRSADRKTSFNVNVAGRASRFVAFSTLFTDEGEKEREEKKKKKGPDPPRIDRATIASNRVSNRCVFFSRLLVPSLLPLSRSSSAGTTRPSTNSKNGIRGQWSSSSSSSAVLARGIIRTKRRERDADRHAR